MFYSVKIFINNRKFYIDGISDEEDLYLEAKCGNEVETVLISDIYDPLSSEGLFNIFIYLLYLIEINIFVLNKEKNLEMILLKKKLLSAPTEIGSTVLTLTNFENDSYQKKKVTC
jgi:hypothetical protein